MTSPTVESDATAIVLLGSFNPAIFTPDWLKRYGLLPDEEFANTKVALMVPQVTRLQLPWAHLQIELGRFQAQASSREHFEPLRDLVLGIFKVLEHTPLRVMGFNRMMHFRVESEEQWHSIGHQLAPKERWRQFVEDPGLLSLGIRGRPPGIRDARFDVTVQPSAQVIPGIFVHTNEQHPQDGSATPDALLGVLQSRWDAALRHAEHTALALIDSPTPDPEALR